MFKKNKQNVTHLEFLSKIICLIIDYSVDKGMSPTESIKTIGQNLIMLAEICTFDHWTKKNDKKG